MNRSVVTVAGLLIGAVVLAAAAVGAWGLLVGDPAGQQGNRLPDAFQYDLTQYKTVDPALLAYHETGGFPTTLAQSRAVAVGPDNRIYVAGDRAVVIFEPTGAEVARLKMDDEPRCLALGTDGENGGRLFVGMKEHAEVFDAQHKRLAQWPTLGQKALLTSIGVSDSDVYLADAGNRIVWRCDAAGKVLKEIGRRDEGRNVPGFVIPSPYFDLAWGRDGLLRVVDPARHRIEAYTPEGDLESHWGKASAKIEGFTGCCNPANFTMLSDGRFVTAEKGLPRVKIYDAQGTFVSVVAGPEQLSPTATKAEETRAEYQLAVFDVAADQYGRILVLDPSAGRVRIFEEKSPSKEPKHE
jgi:hypothetical protein